MQETKTYQMRINISYLENNEIKEIIVEKINDTGLFEKLIINEYTPGLLLNIYSILVCQHLFLRLNTKDRNIFLTRTVGEIFYETHKDHRQKNIITTWKGYTDTEIKDEDYNFIKERMFACPTTINLNPENPKIINLEFIKTI